MPHELPDHALFLYGSLMPGESANGVFGKIDARFVKAHIQARYSADGWGHTEGYPAVILDEKAGKVEGFLVLSNELDKLFGELDAYEGEQYQRVGYHATTEDGKLIACQVYELANELQPEGEVPGHLGV